MVTPEEQGTQNLPLAYLLYWLSSHSLNEPALSRLRATTHQCGGDRDDLELDLGLRPGFTSCLYPWTNFLGWLKVF